VGVTGLAVLAGTGGAYAAGQSGAPTKLSADRAAEQTAFLDDVAKRLNVTRDQLDTAIKGAAEARIDAAVAAGRLTQEQGEAAKRRLAAGAPLLGPGLLGRGGGHPGKLGRGGPAAGLDGAAEYLGLTDAQLRERLRDGDSLADIANAENKSVDGLKAAIKSGITAKLDEAVKAGKLTEAQKTRMLRNVDERIDAIVNNERPRLRRWR